MFSKNAQIKFVISWSCHLKSYNLRGMALEGIEWFVYSNSPSVVLRLAADTLLVSLSPLCPPAWLSHIPSVHTVTPD